MYMRFRTTMYSCTKVILNDSLAWVPLPADVIARARGTWGRGWTMVLMGPQIQLGSGDPLHSKYFPFEVALKLLDLILYESGPAPSRLSRSPEARSANGGARGETRF